jgi:hypothetical protein
VYSVNAVITNHFDFQQLAFLDNVARCSEPPDRKKMLALGFTPFHKSSPIFAVANVVLVNHLVLVGKLVANFLCSR